MIERDFGKYVAVCDCCGESTAPYKSWDACKYSMRDLGWRATKNPETGEWENYCPACVQLLKKKK